VPDAKESPLRTNCDLVIVDEADKMSPTFEDKPTLAFHRRLRRVKEALVTFPDPDTGKAKKLFVKRDVQTSGFDLDGLEVARIAVEETIKYETALGWEVTSVENENRGHDLLSRKPHPIEPAAYIASRFIEVKGRAGVGEVALSSNEYKTAQRLKDDYWLYVVFNCKKAPELHIVQDPARLGCKPVSRVEHYHVAPAAILSGTSEEGGRMADRHITQVNLRRNRRYAVATIGATGADRC
jgi:hypothetical protein